MLKLTSSSAIFDRTAASLPKTATVPGEESTPLQGTTNKERTIRRFKDELQKLKVQGNHSDNESAASSAMNPGQKSPNSSDQLGENEQYAKALLIAVREEIYKKGYKSSNKLRAAPLGKDKNQWKKEEDERISKAEDEMSSIRMQFSFRVPRFLARLKCISSATEAKGHNCSDLSHAGIGILDEAGIKDMHIVGFSAFDHDIILIGKIPPSGLPLDMEKWPSHLAICDPWANIACSAKAFISVFMEKMQKWEGNGKKIFDAAKGVWSSPVYPDLEKELRGHRKVRAPLGDKELKDEDGCTPLMSTVYAGNVDDVQLLLKAGANIETTDINAMDSTLPATAS